MTQDNIKTYLEVIGTERYQPLTDLITKINTCTSKSISFSEVTSDLLNSQSMERTALQ